MNIVADVLVGLVAALHLYFLVLEMFLWTTPTGRSVFGLDTEFAEESKSLAANQGPRLPATLGPTCGFSL
jgi:putative membrane protein